MAALHGAVALVEVDDVTKAVRQDLYLDVAGGLDEALHKHALQGRGGTTQASPHRSARRHISAPNCADDANDAVAEGRPAKRRRGHLSEGIFSELANTYLSFFSRVFAVCASYLPYFVPYWPTLDAFKRKQSRGGLLLTPSPKAVRASDVARLKRSA
eukprot:945482-Pyramimonas_sp.AAC.1